MRRLTIAITALLLALTACSSPTPTSATLGGGSGSGSGVGSGSGLVGGGSSVHLVQGALVRFQACDDFLSHLKAEAIERVGPYGLDWYGHWGYPPVLSRFGEDVALASSEVAAGAADSDAFRFSTTNNQEVGVDEADIVKTDGKRIVTFTSNRLSVIDVTGPKPVLIGSLVLPPEQAVRDLFMHGDRVILLGNTWGLATPLEAEIGFSDSVGGVAAPDRYYAGSPIVTLTEVDISGEPTIERVMQLDGSYISSRMIDGIARVVLTSGPTGFVWAYPEGSGLKAERDAIAANKKIIEESTIDNWVPYFVLTDAAGEVLDEGPAVSCDRAHHPADFAGFNMLSIVTLDLADGLGIVDSTGVLASGETVYSSTDAMYVATNGWFDVQFLESDFDAVDSFEGSRTQIHQFDITGTTTEYSATGSVRGYLLNQFAMSEHNGDLRVASTSTPNWWGRRGPDQESLVSVLRPDDGELELIGQIDGLGRNEQIYSVRFMGDVAYLVTFRQTDPLFTIDLTDPTDPVVRGELKIPGYSAYLHPLSDDLVVGIGQDADNDGRIKGSQVSLFDVSDLDNPKRIAKLALGRDSSSSAEYDHRAFLQWDDTIVVPLTEYSWDGPKNDFFTGAVAIDVGNRTLTEITRVVHPDGDNPDIGWNSTILRSLVVGDSLYTVSNHGVLKSDLASFDDVAWLHFDASRG